MAKMKPQSDHERLLSVRRKQAAADDAASTKTQSRKKTTSNLSDALRAAIAGSGKSANELSRISGVPQPTITRFIAGADMRLATAAKLAEVLDLELTERE